MFEIKYLPLVFEINFTKPVLADSNPLFVLRSMLGFKLKNLCCIARQKSCPDCMYVATCAYAFLFETILPKTNSFQPGRNRASHPYSFSAPLNCGIENFMGGGTEV